MCDQFGSFCLCCVGKICNEFMVVLTVMCFFNFLVLLADLFCCVQICSAIRLVTLLVNLLIKQTIRINGPILLSDISSSIQNTSAKNGPKH